MTRELYLLLHFLGVFLIFGSIIGALIYGKLKPGGAKTPERRLLMVGHGIGLLVLLIAGFGLVAKSGLVMGTWFWVKLGVWAALGYLISPAVRGKFSYVAVYAIAVALVLLASFMGIYKPL